MNRRIQIRRAIIRTIGFCFSFGISILSAQLSDAEAGWIDSSWYYSPDSPAIIDPSTFLPPLFRDDAVIKRYLRDERFYSLRKSHDDTIAVDAIFERALMIAQGETKYALLLATIAVMDHRRLGLKIPLLGSVFIPLTWENDSLFRLRRTHLPTTVLPDRPRASDKDKLQHFFGSAFLAYSTNSRAITDWIGELFELGEDRFVLGGRSDDRDRLANELGRRFGLGLLHDEDLLPSDILWGE